ncbi:MAG TPA: STAS domain-containing protein [Pseudobdellovibrionaceae bacterium]|nr:STAS domain-containing protein [Pseudobdellovibrionaceae bacterium]
MRVNMVEQGEIFFLHIEGRLEIEKIKFLTSQLKSKFQNKKVVFCLEKLSFVGSCGIQKFFLDIDELHKKQIIEARIVGLPQDFRYMLRFNQIANLEFLENVQVAVESFLLPPVVNQTLI